MATQPHAPRRQLLEECADLHVVCDDGTRIPCSKYQTCSSCQVIKWALEMDPDVTELPIPTVASKRLQLALDVVHGMASLQDYDMDQLDEAEAGFDVLNAQIDTAPRAWELVANAPIQVLLPRLSKLVRSPAVDIKAVLGRVICLTPLCDDIMHAVTMCEPDVTTAQSLIRVLAKFVPPIVLLRHLYSIMHNLTLYDAIAILPMHLGVYLHPGEVAQLAKLLQGLPVKNHQDAAYAQFMRNMAAGLHTFDVGPLTCMTFNATTLMYSDSPVTSTSLHVEGRSSRRITKWLKVDMRTGCEVFIKASHIDHMAQVARCLDVRLFVEVGAQHAELWHCWTSPDWNPTVEVSTMNCQHIRGDVAKFYSLINAGTFARTLRLRIDVYYAQHSALAVPPL